MARTSSSKVTASPPDQALHAPTNASSDGHAGTGVVTSTSTTNETAAASPAADASILSNETVYLEDVDMDTTSATVGLAGRDWGQGEALNDRLFKIITWSSPASNTYAPTRLPKAGITFKALTAGANTQFLCSASAGTPVKIWIVGNIAASYMFNRDGDPETQAAIIVVPLNKGCLQACRGLLSKHTSPGAAKPNKDTLDGIRAAKFMTSRVRGSTSEEVKIFDASDAIKPKYEMDRLSAADLMRGDLVVVEMNLQRFHDKTLDSYTSSSSSSRLKRNVTGKSSTVLWRAGFVLQAVYVLRNKDGSEEWEDAQDAGEGSFAV